MTPEQVLAEARRLKQERYIKRDADIATADSLRAGDDQVTVPEAYRDIADVYHSPVIEQEEQTLFGILHAQPQPHIIPPSLEEQALATLAEQWLAAGDIELEAAWGNCAAKAEMAQIHTGIGWLYECDRRDYYADKPRQGEEDEFAYADRYDQYKREAGIAAVFERRYVPTNTVYCVGDVRNPRRIYEIKQITEIELLATWDLEKRDGRYIPKIEGTTPSGYPEDAAVGTNAITVVEYWDREKMMIVVQQPSETKDGLVVDEWEHNKGRVPYYAMPAFETEQLDEDKKFRSPVWGIVQEVKRLNRLVTMKDNVTHLRAYPSWQDVAAKDSSPVLDSQGNPKIATKYEPGQVYHTLPGHRIENIPMEAGSDLLQDVTNTEVRIKQFSLDPIARGASPGADTANSAISQLRRLQRSALERLAKNRALAHREIYRQRLLAVRRLGESVPVFNEMAGVRANMLLGPAPEVIAIAPDQVISTNVHVKYAPDTGTDMLIEEKQASELRAIGHITPIEFHERRGKENPEEYVQAEVLWEVFNQMKDTLITQVLANLGDTQAISRLIAANQETGDAKAAVSGIMGDVAQRQNGGTGMGSGSGGMPRQMGVRSPAVQPTTQPGGGY